MTSTDIRSQVTEKIVSLLEQGVLPWKKEWCSKSGSDLFAVPFNFTTKNRYNGINVVILWAESLLKRYQTDQWATYNQIQNAGEKGTQVVFYKALDITEQREDGSEKEKKIPLMKTFTVFNIEQCDGFENKISSPVEETREDQKRRIEQVEKFVKNSGAEISFGGSRAFYMPMLDKIQMPNFGDFTSAEAFYATTLHELTHWTAHEKRLDRQLGKKFGDLDYAAEELIAELGSCFVCAELGINSALENHASYLDSWLKILKADNKAIFLAAAAASRAADFLNSLQSDESNISRAIA